MAGQTDFHPRLHGFDFKNHWEADENYRSFVRDKITNSLPIISNLIETNPAFAAALMAGLAGTYAVGQVLAPGIFEAIVLPILINQITTTVDDKIKDFLPDHYGACGGMAFASLDYYYKKWPVPKGVFTDPHNPEFNVPPLTIPEAAVLRDYIFKRHRDTWESGAVLDKMFEWYIVLKTLPASVGGGGPEIQQRCKPEWIKLCGLLDQGLPQPIALFYDTYDIFDNHQLVAFGYSGDPYTGPAQIDIYDNNQPNQEVQILFDFTKDELDGAIVETKNNAFKKKTGLKGFFCATYTPETPPMGWGSEMPMTVSPSRCQSARENFHVRGVMSNINRFFSPPKRESLESNTEVTVTPVLADALDMTVVPANFQTSPGPLAHEDRHFVFDADIQFSTAGDYVLFAKVHIVAFDKDKGTIATDFFGRPLARILYMPVLGPGAENLLQLKVLPRLNIIPYNRSHVSCYFPLVEGSDVTLTVEKNPFPGASKLAYQWQIHVGGIATGPLDEEKLVLHHLPAPGAVIPVSITITDPATGCIASGDKSIAPYSAIDASNNTLICNMSHILVRFANPRFFDPLGPDNPIFRKFVEDNVGEIGRLGQQLTKLSKQWLQRQH